MKKFVAIGSLFLFSAGLFFGWDAIGRAGASILDLIHDDPDYPRWMQSGVSKEEFMIRRSEGIAMKRGIVEGQRFDPLMRVEGVRDLEKQERARLDRPPSKARDAILEAWVPIGPAPIPNGQVNVGPSTPASGRVISIAVHPTNPDIVYVGTAQGGLYRSTNGGQVWTPLMDNALTLAVNAIAFVPGQPETLFVGTGEAGFCSDCFFGVGLYRIDNASTTADLTGPIATERFIGRAISKIVFHPTDPNIMFVTSASGQGGIGAGTFNLPAARGVFRTMNALSQAPQFTKLTIAGLAGQDRPFVDMVIDPGNPDVLMVTEVDSFALSEGGVYRSTDALSGNPTFSRTLPIPGTGSTNSRTELALHRSPGGDVTVYAASAQDGGTLHRSIDGGGTWEQRIDNNFCTPQCFYDIAVAVDPNDGNRVYLGGSPTLVFGRSGDGGATFTPNGLNFTSGLHVDTHAIAVAPSDPSIVYFGSDGGIYRTNDVQATPIVWIPLNNSTFSATQFMSLAVHPIDPNYTIGGTQDNGTNIYLPNATWLRINGGDGGYTVIDQNATDTVNVTLYHTFFTQTNFMGYARAVVAGGAWTFFGCGTQNAVANGMTCSASATLFYAPLESGPGVPNTLYFGSDVLYRSADTGVTMQKVSQEPIVQGVAVSAIGIAPQDDNIRIVGMRTGGLFGTTSGSSTLTDLDPLGHVPPNVFIARAAIDPANTDRAYVTLSAFGVPSIWKTENLSNASPSWTAVSSGLPQVPVSAFIIDPQNPNMLYAGTDIGVYSSGDAGATWVPHGTGLPRVAVFDIAIAPGTPRKLRIATHGRGLWELPLAAASPFATLSGRVFSADDRALRGATVSLRDSTNATVNVLTSSAGFFTFEGVPKGAEYTISVRSKRFRFTSRDVQVGSSDIADLNFTGVE